MVSCQKHPEGGGVCQIAGLWPPDVYPPHFQATTVVPPPFSTTLMYIPPKPNFFRLPPHNKPKFFSTPPQNRLKFVPLPPKISQNLFPSIYTTLVSPPPPPSWSVSASQHLRAFVALPPRRWCRRRRPLRPPRPRLLLLRRRRVDRHRRNPQRSASFRRRPLQLTLEPHANG